MANTNPSPVQGLSQPTAEPLSATASAFIKPYPIPDDIWMLIVEKAGGRTILEFFSEEERREYLAGANPILLEAVEKGLLTVDDLYAEIEKQTSGVGAMPPR